MTHNLIADTISLTGHGEDQIEAYLAQPTDADRVGSIVVIHHMPGYDEDTKEICRKFAANGYNALMPNLYSREAPGADPDDAAALVRANGGVPDERLVGDVEAAMQRLTSLSNSNGKVASIGHCSGGRQSFLAGCRLPLDAVIDCYGAFVTLDAPAEMPFKFKAVVGEAPNLSAPVLGLFGADDQNPTIEQVAVLDEALTKAGKEHEFHTYEGAGHAFFWVSRPSYRPETAKEGWRVIFEFLGRTIS
ncbi:MAG: dienelactone hydrolase family protein [Acidimicrobiales bacterium]